MLLIGFFFFFGRSSQRQSSKGDKYRRILQILSAAVELGVEGGCCRPHGFPLLLEEGTGLKDVCWCLVIQTTWTGRGGHQLHLLEQVGVQTAVSCPEPDNHHLLPSVEEMTGILCGCGAEGRLHKGLLLHEVDAVVGLSLFCSKFGELICCFIAWYSTMSWYPLQDYSSMSLNFLKFLRQTREFVSCKRFQDRKEDNLEAVVLHIIDQGCCLHESLHFCCIVGAVFSQLIG